MLRVEPPRASFEGLKAGGIDVTDDLPRSTGGGCQSGCRSSAVVTRTRTCSRRARRSTACDRGAMLTDPGTAPAVTAHASRRGRSLQESSDGNVRSKGTMYFVLQTQSPENAQAVMTRLLD